MTLLELEKRFTYHPPKPGQPEIYAAIRAEAKKLAMLVFEHCPDSRELSLAITNIEEAVFWANAAIARNTDRPIYKGSADEGQEVAGAGEPGGVEACAGACEDGGCQRCGAAAGVDSAQPVAVETSVASPTEGLPEHLL